MGFRASCWMGGRRWGQWGAEGGERSARRGLDGEELFKQRLEELEVEGVGAVGFGVVRIVVNFDEEAVDTSRDRGPREQRNVLGLAAADAVGCRGLLDRVGGIKDDRREPAHDGEGAEVDDQVDIAE